ncbi:hypothetical protein [Streptomyces sp. TS71-3]|uniref:hypothetical protein n=1 Tax=Streptomyces sp. TS71-3 TaxID=2733862 RepID=UPI001BB3E2AD|nr:hypothetical protein [Streptomyces sp. TS71-3]
MKKFTCTAAAALLVLVGSAGLARADATVVEGKVTLDVRGKGLVVKKAGGWIDGHPKGAKAKLYAVYMGSRTEVTNWKKAKREGSGMTKISAVDWNLGNRKFTNGTWLCIQFNKGDDTPCAKIHR